MQRNTPSSELIRDAERAIAAIKERDYFEKFYTKRNYDLSTLFRWVGEHYHNPQYRAQIEEDLTNLTSVRNELFKNLQTPPTNAEKKILNELTCLLEFLAWNLKANALIHKSSRSNDPAVTAQHGSAQIHLYEDIAPENIQSFKELENINESINFVSFRLKRNSIMLPQNAFEAALVVSELTFWDLIEWASKHKTLIPSEVPQSLERVVAHTKDYFPREEENPRKNATFIAEKNIDWDGIYIPLVDINNFKFYGYGNYRLHIFMNAVLIGELVRQHKPAGSVQIFEGVDSSQQRHGWVVYRSPAQDALYIIDSTLHPQSVFNLKNEADLEALRAAYREKNLDALFEQWLHEKSRLTLSSPTSIEEGRLLSDVLTEEEKNIDTLFEQRFGEKDRLTLSNTATEIEKPSTDNFIQEEQLLSDNLSKEENNDLVYTMTCTITDEPLVTPMRVWLMPKNSEGIWSAAYEEESIKKWIETKKNDPTDPRTRFPIDPTKFQYLDIEEWRKISIDEIKQRRLKKKAEELIKNKKLDKTVLALFNQKNDSAQILDLMKQAMREKALRDKNVQVEEGSSSHSVQTRARRRLEEEEEEEVEGKGKELAEPRQSASSNQPANTEADLTKQEVAALEMELQCPITREPMEDPCRLRFADNSWSTTAYERRAINTWLKTNATDPLTRKPFKRPLEYQQLTVKALKAKAMEKINDERRLKNQASAISTRKNRGGEEEEEDVTSQTRSNNQDRQNEARLFASSHEAGPSGPITRNRATEANEIAAARRKRAPEIADRHNALQRSLWQEQRQSEYRFNVESRDLRKKLLNEIKQFKTVLMKEMKKPFANTKLKSEKIRLLNCLITKIQSNANSFSPLPLGDVIERFMKANPVLIKGERSRIKEILYRYSVDDNVIEYKKRHFLK